METGPKYQHRPENARIRGPDFGPVTASGNGDQISAHVANDRTFGPYFGPVIASENGAYRLGMPDNSRISGPHR